MIEVISILVDIFFIYLALGLLFALWFVFAGASRLDEGVSQAPWHFRLTDPTRKYITMVTPVGKTYQAKNMNRTLRKRHFIWWVVLTIILIPVIVYAYLNLPVY